MIRHGKRATLGLVGAVATGAVLFFSMLQLGVAIDPVNLDQAWLYTLAHGHRSELQHGIDLIFSYGPHGFTHPYQAFDPTLFPTYAAWHALSVLLHVIVIVVACRQLCPARYWVLLVLLSLSFSLVKTDAIHYFAAACGSALLQRHVLGDDRSSTRVAATFVGALLLAHLALVKFGYLLLAVGALGAVLALTISRRRWRDGFTAATMLVTATCALWSLSGQGLENLPAFIRLGWRVAADYDGALSHAGDVFPLLASLTVLGLATVRTALAFRTSREGRVAGLWALAFLLLVWKASFVRQDAGHVLVFFTFAAGWALALPALAPGAAVAASTLPRRKPRHLSLVARADFATAMLALAVWTSVYGGLLNVPADALRSLIADHRQTLSLLSGRYFADQSARFERTRADHALPLILARAGEAPVDTFGGTQSIALLNGLALRPRPTIQEHMAFSPALTEANGRHLAAVDGPRFVLFHANPVDGALLAAQDARAFIELLYRFAPVLTERGLLLLERRDVTSGPRIRAIADAGGVSNIGDLITVPPNDGKQLALSITLEPTLLSRLAASLFRAPAYALEIETSDGRREQFRMQERTWESGVLVDPLIRSMDDVARWFGERAAGNRPVRVRLTIASRRPAWLLPKTVAIRWFQVQ